MTVEYRARPLQAVAKPEVHRLRELDDPIRREVGNDPLAPRFVPGPDIAEVAAASQQDDAVAHSTSDLPARVAPLGTHPGDRLPAPGQPGALPEPYGVVTDVVVRRKPEDDTGSALRNGAVERRVELLAEIVHDCRALIVSRPAAFGDGPVTG